MDYSTYENSKMILDQSGRQQINFITFDCGINAYDFLEDKKIEIVATTDSANEFYEADKQTNEPNLFSECDKTSATVPSFNDGQSYVLSKTNGSLTRKELDYNGCPLEIMAISEESQTGQFPLYNTTIPYNRITRKIERKKRGYADKSNIYLARDLKQRGERFSLLANDKDQIAQFKIEGYKYLRPSDILIWMERDNYIKNQKAVWCYQKIREHNSQWTKKEFSFKNLKIIESTFG